ncbi:hypothetical protein FQZ97_1070740 [compost metagenome]
MFKLSALRPHKEQQACTKYSVDRKFQTQRTRDKHERRQTDHGKDGKQIDPIQSRPCIEPSPSTDKTACDPVRFQPAQSFGRKLHEAKQGTKDKQG